MISFAEFKYLFYTRYMCREGTSTFNMWFCKRLPKLRRSRITNFNCGTNANRQWALSHAVWRQWPCVTPRSVTF